MNIVKAKLDIIFKMLFTKDLDMLKAFVGDMLDIPVDEIDDLHVLNPEITPMMVDGKESRLDLKLSIKEMIVNVEIQLCNEGNFRERSVYYWSKNYTDELKQGEDYIELKKTISINILNFKLFDCKEMCSRFSLYEETRHEKLTDKCSILFFELKKVNNKVDKNDRKKLWLQLINAETEEELDMLDNTGLPEIQKAVGFLHEMSADDMAQEMARVREKTIHDSVSALNYARREGKEEGIQEGRQEERQETIARMRETGFTEEQIRMVFGDMDE